MPLRILAVDDNREIRQAVQDVLERKNMHVMLAESAEDGLDALSRAHFDLVITDLRMIRKNGLDMVRETRDHGIDVPFILLTADADLAIRKKVSEMGVVAVLNKPVHKQVLLDHVGNALLTSQFQGTHPNAQLHKHCRANCGFSIDNFCSLPTAVNVAANPTGF